MTLTALQQRKGNWLQVTAIVTVICLFQWNVVLSTPVGFSTFFIAEDCPNGWAPLIPTEGRLIVSVANPEQGGITVNSPLTDQEDRVHTHSYSTSVNLPSKSIAAIDCCNDQGACNDNYHVSGSLDKSTSGYPFCQLLLCTLKQETTDPVPIGSIGFFDSTVSSCPPNWQAWEESNGRIILPGYAKEGVIPSSAPPLKNGEDRLHFHEFITNISTTDVSYAGAEGCCNSNLAPAGTYKVEGNGSSDSSNLPYIQLLTCVSQNETFDSKFPPETLIFNEIGCPPGWNVSLEAAGRFLVSLPSGGNAGATFGSNSLPPGFTGNPTHLHQFHGDIQTRSCGVGLASGCCGSGYVGNQMYPFHDESVETTLNLPFISVPMCVQL